MELLPVAFLIDGLSIYKNLRNDPVISSLRRCVFEINTGKTAEEGLKAVRAYTELCSHLYESEHRGNLSSYIHSLVFYDNNIFSRACAEHAQHQLPEPIQEAARSDLKVLFTLSNLADHKIKKNFLEKFPSMPFIADNLPGYTVVSDRRDWGEDVDSIASFYAHNGVGIYAQHKAFLYEEGVGIQPVLTVDPIRLSDLKQYETQRNKIIENTLAFLEGHPYNNVLLYGDRGTGKSSTVKALLNEYCDRNLRMVEISKRCIGSLDKLIQEIQTIPLKFIVFIDDLTFNENDDNYGILKAVLEGSLSVRPKNVAIYATTNRRHLIKETFSAREGNEVHRADTLDENLSLSDRFGLTVTFIKPNKDDFLDIVRQLAKDRKLQVDDEKLTLGAERFALANSGRSPRLAKQYIDHIEARIKLGLPI